MDGSMGDLVVVDGIKVQNITDILLFHGVYDDFRVQELPNGNVDSFLQLFSTYVRKKFRERASVDLNCLLLIIYELSSSSFSGRYDDVVLGLVDLVPYCLMKNCSVGKAVDGLRCGLRTIRTPGEETDGTRQSLPLFAHSKFLKALHSRVIADDPPHIFFPGDKDSFLQVSSIPWNCSTGYSLLIWLKIPSATMVKGFELFRCRNPQLTIDAAMLYIPEEGAFTIRVVTNSERRGRDEIRGKLLMSTDTWHLLAIKHTSPKDGADQMTISVDGTIFIESELNFPTATSMSTDSHWTFGIGLYGMISSIVFCEADMPPNAVKFIHGLGPYVMDLRQGVSCPQSSYDSGHVTLGTLITKGTWPARLNALPIGFSVNALMIASGGAFMHSKPVDTSNYYMEMVPLGNDNSQDTPVVMSVTGKSLVVLNESFMENILEAGGCNLFLYLFWAYGSYDFKNTDDSVAMQPVVREAMLLVLNILAHLVRSHCDLREQFIQLHGFHIIAHCLLTTQQNSSSSRRPVLTIDKALIDAVVQLVEALGSDSVNGDGIASAFQGLLFDFRVWNYCDLATLKYFLECISSVSLKAGDQLFKCIGMQKIMDIFRMHISKVLNLSADALPMFSVSMDVAEGGESLEASGLMDKLLSEESPQQLARDCADEIHRLMIIIKDAAVENALKSKANDAALDIEALLICLAETNNSLLAERIFRLLANVRVTNPTILQRGLIASRFYDTILISLWMKRGLSLAVRSAALSNLIWLLNLELHELPQQLMQFRRSIIQGSGAGTSKMSDNSMGKSGRVRATPSPNDPARSRAIASQVRDQVKPIARWWKVLHLLAGVMSKALEEGLWGEFSPPCLSLTGALALPKPDVSTIAAAPVGSSAAIANADRAMFLMVQELTGSNPSDAWIILPFLPPLLSRVGIEACQKVLMQLNILFKTDEAQCEALAHLEERSWIELFVQIALIGELRSTGAEHEECSGSGEGSHTSPTAEQTVASTCVELALEMLSIVLDYKIKFHPAEATHCWAAVEDTFITICKTNIPQPAALDVEKRLMRRCVALILQRLVKTPDEYWNALTFRCVDSLLCLVSERKLCGVAPSFDSFAGANSSDGNGDNSDLLGLDDPPTGFSSAVVTQTAFESHVLSLVLDFLRTTRKVSGRGRFGGAEWVVLHDGFMIILACLAIVPPILYDRMSEEIMGYIKRVTESSTAPFSPAEFTKLIMQVLLALKAVSVNRSYDQHMRAWYTSMIFDIIGHFSELRRTLLTKGLSLPVHVEDILQMLVCVENLNDIALMFGILEAMMKERYGTSSSSAVDAASRQSACDARAGEHEAAEEDDADGIIDYSNIPDSGDDIISYTVLDELPILALAPTEGFVNAEADRGAIERSRTTDSGPDFLHDQLLDLSQPSTGQSPASDTAATGTGPGVGIGSSSLSASSPLPPSQQQQSVAVDATSSQLKGFTNWLKVRQGIIAERVDTERARITRIMNAQDLSAEATRKYWRKLRRKIESESFQESHRCQWKLGVAHEGTFFGRKRIVLRPRFDNINLLKGVASSGDLMSSITGIPDEVEISSDELNRALARKCSGYIKDVTRTENGDAKEEQAYYRNAGEQADPLAAGAADGAGRSGAMSVAIPGSGWGLVDADGSEEGFGVVGLIQDPAYIVEDGERKELSTQPSAASGAMEAGPSSTSSTVSTTVGGTASATATAAGAAAGGAATKGGGASGGSAGISPLGLPGSEPSLVGDMMGDVHVLEENFRTGRTVIETGPCHSGTYRVGSGLTKSEARVLMVTASGNFWGFLSFNGKEIFYRSSFEQEDAHKEDNASVNLHKEQRMRRRRWLLSAVSGVYLRRFRLRDSALEVFFRRGKHRNFFVDFGHTKENAKQRNEFARMLMAAAPSNAFKQSLTMTPFRMVYEHGVQEKWLAGKMSNFDYLMALNTLAGRSYNDLCQYPVMPWVIADYSSSAIDLKNTAVYRDLSKPMGALNEHRLKEFLDRFYSFEENVTSGIPAFMYGSHYSTMVGVVLHFLVRLQPYAALHREMQNGHFDVPDRLFSSIPRSFQHNTTQLSEVKELIPEWFTTPDMFRNVNRFNFGHTQDGDVIDDVELPPWAATPEDFVRINREALESDYVTEHLHEWIDLIFGYKQRGPDAIDAKNVFYYLTYYGAVDHYMIEDETLRKATELQIAHFGQTPMQLFRTPHPARKVTGPSASLALTRPLRQVFSQTASTKLDFKLPRNDEESIAYYAPSTLVLRKSQSVIVQQTVLLDRIVCILDNGVVEVIKHGTSEEAKAALLASQAASSMNGGGGNGSGSAGGSGGGRGASGNRRVRDGKERGERDGADRERDGAKAKTRTEDLLGLEGGSGSPSEPASTGPVRKNSSLSTSSQDDDRDTGYSLVPAMASSSPLLLRAGEVLVYAEKEFAHFDVVPRLPLPRHYRLMGTSHDGHSSPVPPLGPSSASSPIPPSSSAMLGCSKEALESLLKVRPQMQSSMSPFEKLSHLVVFSRSSKLCLAAGRIDGVIVVREIDDRTGFIRSAGEFAAHRKRVVSIAMDTNPPEYDIVASVDEGGTILVWTILNTRTKGTAAAGGSQTVHVISRRPQRQFRCEPPTTTDGSAEHCGFPINVDISSQMGVVVAVSGEHGYVFSIERNELLFRFVLHCFATVKPPVKPQTVVVFDSEGRPAESPFVGYSHNGPLEEALEIKLFRDFSSKKEDLLAPKYFARRMVVSDYGMIIVHLEAFVFVESSFEYEDQLERQHLLMAHTVTGVHTQTLLCASPVTCLVCPDRGEVVISGSQDGGVRFYRVQDLALLYQFFPHTSCTAVSLALPGTKFVGNGGSSGSSASNQAGQRRKASMLATPATGASSSSSSSGFTFEGGNGNGNNGNSVAPSPIVSISIGPNRAAPTLISISTEAGTVFLKAFPDYVRWEKQRQPSTLAQLVNSAPLQAVKGTLLQAQNWTQETAGVIAQNARSLADDAVSELKKLQRSSLVKGVASFFGVGKPAGDDASAKPSSNRK